MSNIADWEDLEIEGEADDNAGLDTKSDNEGTGDGWETEDDEASVETSPEDADEGGSDTGADVAAEDKAPVDDDARIQELANALKRQDEDHKRALAELAARDATRQKENELSLREASLGAQKAEIDRRLKEAEALYRNAREDSNTQAELKAIKDIQNLELQSLAIKNDLETITTSREELENYKPTQAAPRNEGNPKALAWLNRNSWVQESKPYVQKAVALQAEILLEEGIDPNSDKFYERLDSNVAALVKANGWNYPVNAKSKSQSTNKKATMEKNNATDRPRSNQPPSEKGSGEVVTRRTETGKTKVRVTPDDKEMARNLGIEIVGKDGKYTPRFQAYMRERVKTDSIFTKQDKSMGPVWSDV